MWHREAILALLIGLVFGQTGHGESFMLLMPRTSRGHSRRKAFAPSFTGIDHCLAIVASDSSLPASTGLNQNASVTSGVCTGCLIEALNPFTIPDPTSFSNQNSTTVITTATIIRSTTFFDPTTPVPFEVNYYTKKVTSTIQLPQDNDTVYSTISTSTYTYNGVVLTWPTKYLSYSAFAGATQCSATPTAVTLPEGTNAAKLIYPIVDGSGFPADLADYLETLPEFADAGLVNCSSLVLSKADSQRLFGRSPVLVGPLGKAAPYARRAMNETITKSITPQYQQPAPNPSIASTSLQSHRSDLTVPASSSSTQERPNPSSHGAGTAHPVTSTIATTADKPAVQPSFLSSTNHRHHTGGHKGPKHLSSGRLSSTISSAHHYTQSLTPSTAGSSHFHSGGSFPTHRSNVTLSTVSHTMVGTITSPHLHTGTFRPIGTGWNKHKGHCNGTNCTVTSYGSIRSSVAFDTLSYSYPVPQTTRKNKPGIKQPHECVDCNGPEALSSAKLPSFPVNLGQGSSTEVIPNYKTSVAVLTQVTTDASTTVKRPGSVSKPAVTTSKQLGDIPNHQNNPVGEGDGNKASGGVTDDARAGATPTDGAVGLGSIIKSVAKQGAPESDPPAKQTPGGRKPGQGDTNAGNSGGDSGSQPTQGIGSNSHRGTSEQNPGSDADSSPGDNSSPNEDNGNSSPGAAPSPQTVDIGGSPVVVNPLPKTTKGRQHASSTNDHSTPDNSDGTNGGDTSDKSTGQIESESANGGDGEGELSDKNGRDGVVVGGKTIQPGQVKTINEVPVSLAPGGSTLVVGGTKTVTLSKASEAVDIGGKPEAVVKAAPDAGGVTLNGKTIRPDQVVTVNGVSVSLDRGGSSLIIGGSRTVAVQQVKSTPPTIQIGASQATAQANGNFIIGSQTLRPGASALVVSGTTVSLNPDGNIVAINGRTSHLIQQTPAPTLSPVLTIGGHTVTASILRGHTAFVVGPGKTLTPGGVITVSGTTLSMPRGNDASVLVVNGQTSTLRLTSASTTVAPVLTLGGQPVTASVSGSHTAFVVGPGKTLTPGGTVVVSGTTISLPNATPARLVVVNGQTSSLGMALPEITTAPVLTIGDIPYTASIFGTDTAFVIGPRKLLFKGGTAVVSGTTYSYPSKGSGTIVVIDGRSSTLGAATITAAPVLTINGTPYTASTSGLITDFVLGSQTLSRGGAVTIDGTTYRYPAKGVGSIVLVNGKPSSLGHAYGTGAPDITFHGRTYAPITKDSSTYYIIRGATLLPGGMIDIHGTRVSLAPWESILVVGTRTFTLKAPATISASATSSANAAATTPSGGDNGLSASSTSTRNSANGTLKVRYAWYLVPFILALVLRA